MNKVALLALIAVLSLPAFGQTVAPPQPPPLSQTYAGGSVPVPDPTRLTTEATEKLEARMKELFGFRLADQQAQIDLLRAGQMGRAKEIAEGVAALGQLMDEKLKVIDRLQELVQEKFKGVDQQFAGRDVALAAALLAQKTSVEEQNKSNALSASKSEAGFSKQIDGISTLIAAQTKSTDDKISDIKDRLATTESSLTTRITALESRSAGQGDSVGWIFGGVGVFASIAAVIGLIITMTRHPTIPVHSPSGRVVGQTQA